MAEQEGVIKFRLDHTDISLEEDIDLSALSQWRAKLLERGLIGQESRRYDGLGFGNLSMRWNDGFLITGSQTGHIKSLSLDHYAMVDRADPSQNFIASRGQVEPSSESLTHAAVYAGLSDVKFVFHAHSPEIWSKGRALGFPATRDVLYGTPEMADEVKRLLMFEVRRATPIFTMAGHADGVVSFGTTADEAGQTLLSAQEQADT